MKKILLFLSYGLLFLQQAFGQGDFRPFITEWDVGISKEVKISLNKGFTYNFQFIWKDNEGNVYSSGTVTGNSGFFTTNFAKPVKTNSDEPDIYQLEITGQFPHFIVESENINELIDVHQWGDIEWESMKNSFMNWPGKKFSATDVPDLSNVTSMFNTFRDAVNFNDNLNHWDVSNITTMESLFHGDTAFNQDISKWNVSSVLDMIDMFVNAFSFDQDISSWDVSSVLDMRDMFLGASLFNSNISNWDVSSVKNIRRMFENATSFNQDLSSWNVGLVVDMTRTFRKSGLSRQNYDKILIGWANLDSLQSDVSLGAQGITFCKAEEAKNILKNTFNWDITDDGQVCSGETDILSFGLDEQTWPAAIDTADHEIDIEVAFGAGLTTLAPSITLSPGATSTPASGEVIDFTHAITYTVTAEDGITTQDWLVTVNETLNSEADILGFELAEKAKRIVIDPVNFTIDIEVVPGTDITTLTPTFTLSTGATSIPASGEVTDFTNAVTYTVTAEDGLIFQDWIVTVHEEETAGITENENKIFTIYPNPFRNTINVETMKESSVYIADPNGIPVTKKKVGPHLKFDLSNLTSGVYIVVISGKKRVYSQAIIKE